MSLKISFDFDNSLSEEYVQKIAAVFILICDVWIVTSRSENNRNDDLFEVVKKLGIPVKNVIFTDGGYKWSTLKYYNFDVHFDDQVDEVLEINNLTDCNAILVGLNNLEDFSYLWN